MEPIRITVDEDLKTAFSIRKEVFVEEQGVPLEDEFDEFDTLNGQCKHILVYYNQQPVGTGRLRTLDGIGKLERICILEPYRKFGLGKEIINALEEIAQEMGLFQVKFTFYILGILILTLGITLTIHSNLGTSPFDALLVGLSVNVGLTVGSWEIIAALILICCNALLRRQRPEVLGLVTAFITGIVIDMWLVLLHNLITPELWLSKLICFGIGLVVIGLGTSIYLQTNFAPIPIDRLTLIIQELTKMNILFSRTVIYLLFLIMAVIFSGTIGIGTLLTVSLGGPILNFFMPITKKVLNLFLSNSGTSVKYDSDKNHYI